MRAMSPEPITYVFSLEDGKELRFGVDFDRDVDATQVAPAWTHLSNHQCEGCPLEAQTHPHCPAAVDTALVIDRFSKHLSYERVQLTVLTAQREIHKETDMQSAVESLLGLIMATSACPILSRFRAMARFHLPLANQEETLFRTVGAFLVEQHHILRAGGTPDWELKGLAELYAVVQEVNESFLERIRPAVEADANQNALVSLFARAFQIRFSLDRDLETLSQLFEDSRPPTSRLTAANM